MAQLCLRGLHKALSSIPSTTYIVCGGAQLLPKNWGCRAAKSGVASHPWLAINSKLAWGIRPFTPTNNDIIIIIIAFM